MERGGKFSIARFPTNSLTTTTFRWLHEEAWEEPHQRFFLAAMERRSALGIMHSVPYEKGKRRPAPELRGVQRVVLELDPAAWWLTPDGVEARKILAYLEKAVAFQNRPKARPTPRGGVFTRMFQSMRWR